MISLNEYGSNSWELKITVDHHNEEGEKYIPVQVSGELHVGGLMLRLVEKIGEYSVFKGQKNSGNLKQPQNE